MSVSLMVYASWLRDTESIIVASSVVDFALILATLVFGFVCWKEQLLRFFLISGNFQLMKEG